MRVVLLAGGLGTRLREETEFRPKPMVEVGGQPVLWHIMKLFAHHGLTDFIVCVGYRGDVIKDYFLNYESRTNDFTVHLGSQHSVEYHGGHAESDWRVSVVDTGQETMTGGRVKRIEPYGDGLANVDIRALLSFHVAHGKLATVSTVRPLSRFGIMEMDADGKVRQFREKPLSEDYVNAGYFVFEKRVLDYLDDKSVLEREPLEELARDGELVAYRHDGFFQPMDTYREFTMLNELWDAGAAPWKVWS